MCKNNNNNKTKTDLKMLQHKWPSPNSEGGGKSIMSSRQPWLPSKNLSPGMEKKRQFSHYSWGYYSMKKVLKKKNS